MGDRPSLPFQLVHDKAWTNQHSEQTASGCLGKRAQSESVSGREPSGAVDTMTTAHGVHLLAPGSTSKGGMEAEIWNLIAKGMKPENAGFVNELFEEIMKEDSEPESEHEPEPRSSNKNKEKKRRK
jgi:hypothetical protein